MTLIIVILLLLGYLVIATGHLTGVNKAAIAVFIGTVGWVVYICYGTDFVMAHHAVEYMVFLAGNEPSSDAVKYFIYNEVFLYYVGRAASIVMFLLATMSIIEILNNNGCFDFISKWIKTRNSKRLLWTIMDDHPCHIYHLCKPRQPDNDIDDVSDHASDCSEPTPKDAGWFCHRDCCQLWWLLYGNW